MRLTQHSDYSLRVLLYLAVNNHRRSTVREIAERYQISRNHLTKVVQKLANNGYIESSRGTGGGLRLQKPPEQIGIGAVIRLMEPDFDLVECFRPDNQCLITSACKLKMLLSDACKAFLNELDGHTLAELIGPSQHSLLHDLLQNGDQFIVQSD